MGSARHGHGHTRHLLHAHRDGRRGGDACRGRGQRLDPPACRACRAQESILLHRLLVAVPRHHLLKPEALEVFHRPFGATLEGAPARPQPLLLGRLAALVLGDVADGTQDVWTQVARHVRQLPLGQAHVARGHELLRHVVGPHHARRLRLEVRRLPLLVRREGEYLHLPLRWRAPAVRRADPLLLEVAFHLREERMGVGHIVARPLAEGALAHAILHPRHLRRRLQTTEQFATQRLIWLGLLLRLRLPRDGTPKHAIQFRVQPSAHCRQLSGRRRRPA